MHRVGKIPLDRPLAAAQFGAASAISQSALTASISIASLASGESLGVP